MSLKQASVSSPTWEKISFLDVSSGSTTVHFGVFGYTGSKTSIGYHFNPPDINLRQVNPLPGTQRDSQPVLPAALRSSNRPLSTISRKRSSCILLVRLFPLFSPISHAIVFSGWPSRNRIFVWSMRHGAPPLRNGVHDPCDWTCGDYDAGSVRYRLVLVRSCAAPVTGPRLLRSVRKCKLAHSRSPSCTLAWLHCFYRWHIRQVQKARLQLLTIMSHDIWTRI